jgi:hypothetical protein
MHSIFEYETIRRGYEELLKQAEQERLLREATVRDWASRRYLRKSASWLGSHMVRWGHMMKNVGKSRLLSSLWPASPHH